MSSAESRTGGCRGQTYEPQASTWRPRNNRTVWIIIPPRRDARLWQGAREDVRSGGAERRANVRARPRPLPRLAWRRGQDQAGEAEGAGALDQEQRTQALRHGRGSWDCKRTSDDA